MKLKEKIHNKEFSFNIMSNNWRQYEQLVYGEKGKHVHLHCYKPSRKTGSQARQIW